MWFLPHTAAIQLDKNPVPLQTPIRALSLLRAVDFDSQAELQAQLEEARREITELTGEGKRQQVHVRYYCSLEEIKKVFVHVYHYSSSSSGHRVDTGRTCFGANEERQRHDIKHPNEAKISAAYWNGALFCLLVLPGGTRY